LNAKELRAKSEQELEAELIEQKKKLAQLKVQKLTKASVPEIKAVRKDIARVLTVINLQKRDAVRESYAGKEHIPKQLREKKTRALRRALTAEEKSHETVRQRNRRVAFPRRLYAVKA